jgi:hypothetical protein
MRLALSLFLHNPKKNSFGCSMQKQTKSMPLLSQKLLSGEAQSLTIDMAMAM